MRRLFLVLPCVLLLGLAVIAQADPDPPDRLSVMVQDSQGKPLAGIQVTFIANGEDVISDEKGLAVLTDLPSGTSSVHVEMNDYDAPVAYYSVDVPVTLAGPDTHLDVTLQRDDRPKIVPRPPGTLGYLATPPVPPGSGPAWRAAREDDLREAAFRRVFADFAVPRRFGPYYISVCGFYPGDQGVEGSQDPDAALLQRFPGNRPSVRAASVLAAGDKNWHNQNKRPWVIFRVRPIYWVSDTCVKIIAGSLESGCVSSETLFLTCTLHDGRWEIVDFAEISV